MAMKYTFVIDFDDDSNGGAVEAEDFAGALREVADFIDTAPYHNKGNCVEVRKVKEVP